MYQPTSKEASAIAYSNQVGLSRTEVQTLVTQYQQPLQAQGYAPVTNRGDRLPLYIMGGLVAAMLGAVFIHFSDGEKRELQAQNAQLTAQQAAIASCIKGVVGQ